MAPLFSDRKEIEMKNQLKIISVFMLIAFLLAACVPGLLNIAPVVSEPEPVVVISTIPANTASISGVGWHDLCALAGGEGGMPIQPSAGCVLSNDRWLQSQWCS
jgi:hypothetical protein